MAAQIVEAIVDQDGNVHLLQPVHLSAETRAFVTILEEEPANILPETALLSERSLAEDWLKEEEDKAWSHLQLAQ